MLIKIIFNYILGYIRISVEGYYIERFINICRNNRITMWKLKRDKNVKIDLNIGINDLKKVAKIAKQTKCKIKILNKKGLPFIFNKYKKRKIFFVFLVFIIILLGISSNFVWNIDIKYENNSIILTEDEAKSIAQKHINSDIVDSNIEIVIPNYSLEKNSNIYKNINRARKAYVITLDDTLKTKIYIDATTGDAIGCNNPLGGEW